MPLTRSEEHLLRVMAHQARLYTGLHCEADYRAVESALAEIDRLRAAGDALADAVLIGEHDDSWDVVFAARETWKEARGS